MTIDPMTTSVSGLKPPKPPCWRDFVQHGKKENSSSPLDISDCNKTCGIKSSSHDLVENNRSSSIPRPIKPIKRVRARIHRTRSEHLIQDEDLPETNMAVTLANTRPKEIGLRKQYLGDRLYKEENTKRCQTWLASIEACEPLDEITYTQSNDVDSVIVEVPEETMWDGEGGDLRPPFNTSASSSDEEQNNWRIQTKQSNPSIRPDANLYKEEIIKMTAEVHKKLAKGKSLSIVDPTGIA